MWDSGASFRLDCLGPYCPMDPDICEIETEQDQDYGYDDYDYEDVHLPIPCPFEEVEYLQGGPEWRTHCQTALIPTTTPPIPTIPGTSHLFG